MIKIIVFRGRTRGMLRYILSVPPFCNIILGNTEFKGALVKRLKKCCGRLFDMYGKGWELDIEMIEQNKRRTMQWNVRVIEIAWTVAVEEELGWWCCCRGSRKRYLVM